METKSGDTVYVSDVPHHAARPMKVVMDRDGCTWLCDTSVDETKDLKDQGCWRCAEVPFTRND
jgi:streptogramin lyase